MNYAKEIITTIFQLNKAVSIFLKQESIKSKKPHCIHSEVFGGDGEI